MRFRPAAVLIDGPRQTSVLSFMNFFFAHPSVINVGNQDLDGSILCSDVRPFPIPI